MSIEVLQKYANTEWGKKALNLALAAQLLKKSMETLGANKGLSLGENLGLTDKHRQQMTRIAEERLRTKHTDQAISMFTIAAALGETTDGNYMRLGQSLQSSGDYQGAVKAYQMAMCADPTNPLIPFGIAQCLIAKNERKAAISFLKMANKNLTEGSIHKPIADKIEQLIKALKT